MNTSAFKHLVFTTLTLLIVNCSNKPPLSVPTKEPLLLPVPVSCGASLNVAVGMPTSPAQVTAGVATTFSINVTGGSGNYSYGTNGAAPTKPMSSSAFITETFNTIGTGYVEKVQVQDQACPSLSGTGFSPTFAVSPAASPQPTSVTCTATASDLSPFILVDSIGAAHSQALETFNISGNTAVTVTSFDVVNPSDQTSNQTVTAGNIASVLAQIGTYTFTFHVASAVAANVKADCTTSVTVKAKQVSCQVVANQSATTSISVYTGASLSVSAGVTAPAGLLPQSLVLSSSLFSPGAGPINVNTSVPGTYNISGLLIFPGASAISCAPLALNIVQLPNLAGYWHGNIFSTLPCTIQQNGTNLFIQVGNLQSTTATFLPPSSSGIQFLTTSWMLNGSSASGPLTATITAQGTIAWSNNTAWARCSPTTQADNTLTCPSSL